jgi:hypothetical protein
LLQDRYAAAERLSTVALVVLGSMSVAETTGVAVQSILTVGGIGGKLSGFRLRYWERESTRRWASQAYEAVRALGKE